MAVVGLNLQTDKGTERQIHWASCLWSGGLFIAALIYLIPLDEPVRWGIGWLPALGIEFSVYIDGLSRLFVFLITGIGFFIFLFSGNYLKGHPHFQRFFLYLHLFTIAMLGVVVADNLITLFVFWELTSLTSYLLIGFNHKESRSRRAALQGLLITATGGLCLLAGFILIGAASNTLSLAELLNDGDVLKDHPWALAIFVLLALGAVTKSAQFPFHFWLPNAMEAPTPVSAFLHSATMVKAGIYLLARFHPELSEFTYWMPVLGTLGVITALMGGLFALQQRDLKQMAAYTTLMALGTLTALLSQPDPAIFAAAMAFLVAHALYKASLFLSIGALDHALGEKYFSTLNGLWHRHKPFAGAWLLTLLSLAGLPPAMGFIAKELLYDGLIQSMTTPLWLFGGLFVANAMMVALAVSMGRRIIKTHTKAAPTALPMPEIAGPVLMAILGIVLAIVPQWSDPLIRDILRGLGPNAENAIVPVGLWHGFNWALASSFATIALGIFISFIHPWVFRRLNKGQWFQWDDVWDGFLSRFQTASEALTDRLQTHQLSRDLTWILSTLVILGTVVFLSHADNPQWHFEPAPLKLWLIAILVCAGTALSLVAQSRIAAITGLGVVGIGVALVFIIFGAPDVAITQLLVETLLVVFIAVALLNLPSLPKQQGVRFGHAALSIAAGLLVTVILWSIFTTDLDRTLTAYFEQNSYPAAFGRNIVNVILVDFRALDTFGEIAVVLTSAIGAIALLKNMRVRPR